MVNVIGILEPLFERGWNIREYGKITHAPQRMSVKNPFHSANLVEHGYDCRWEHSVLFDVVYRQRAVPIRCHSCFKVVLKPTSLRDVYKIEEMQQRGSYPAKVGMETRATVKRPWGAYWYTNSVEEGRQRYEFVKAWAADALEDEWSILLKRGCTEFEQACGPSDRWQIQPNQQEIEDAINEVVEREPPVGPQPPALVEHLHARWEGWERLMRPYVTYHEEGDDSKELAE